MSWQNKRVARRTFMRECARGVATAVLGTLGVVLAGRSVRNRGQGESCSHRGFCRHCEARQRCVLPQALSYRRVMTADAKMHGRRGRVANDTRRAGSTSD